MKNNRLVIFTDGCSKGNPGPAGIGFVVYQDDNLHPVLTFSDYIGVATNNQAEYKALIAALEYALNLQAGIVEIRSDSELIVNQMNGAYRVRKAELKPLYEKAKSLSGLISDFGIRYVPREKNRGADALANKGLKRA
jgi:ribonuclease HI